MSDRCFVDTNILMYAHDVTAGFRHAQAGKLVARLWEAGTGALSTQVLQELAVNLRRKAGQPLSILQTKELLSDYLTWWVVENDRQAILEALALEEQYQISFWDALIVQAANTCRSNILYTEDLSHGQFYGSVQVVNPFIVD